MGSGMARTPIHPGEILADELQEIGLSAKKLADVIEMPPNRLYQLLAGKRNGGYSPSTCSVFRHVG
jgi:plasmid maintenance system antidote protein VapI